MGVTWSPQSLACSNHDHPHKTGICVRKEKVTIETIEGEGDKRRMGSEYNHNILTFIPCANKNLHLCRSHASQFTFCLVLRVSGVV